MNHHRNASFTGNGVIKTPKTNIDINKRAKLPCTDPLNINIPGSIFAHESYGIPRLPHKDINRGQYVVI